MKEVNSVSDGVVNVIECGVICGGMTTVTLKLEFT